VEMPTEENPVVVHNGDCLDLLRQLPDGCVDAVVTDPPYGVELGNTNNNTVGGRHGLVRNSYATGGDTYEEYLVTVPPAIVQSRRVADRVAVFIGPHIWDLPKADAIGGVYCPNAAARHQWGFKNLLPVLFYGKAPDLHLGVREQTVIRSTVKAEKNGHPCPKPVEWMRWLIRLTTRPDETVLDPFAGSGTTGVAAMLEGRRAILIEREPAYCDIIRRRLDHASGTGKGSLFAGAAN